MTRVEANKWNEHTFHWIITGHKTFFPHRYQCEEFGVLNPIEGILLMGKHVRIIDQRVNTDIRFLVFFLFGKAKSNTLCESMNLSAFYFIFTDLSWSRFWEGYHGLFGVLHSPQRRLQVVGWVEKIEGKSWKFKAFELLITNVSFTFLGSLEHLQVRCFTLSQSLQCSNSPRHDVGSSRFHLHTASSILRVLQRWVLRSRIGGTCWFLSSGADLLRVKMRNTRTSRPYVNPQIQRLLETLEEMSTLSAWVLGRYSFVAREHMPEKPNPMSAEMWSDDADTFRTRRTFKRRMQGFGSAMLVQRSRMPFQGPSKSPRFTPRSQRCISSLADGATVS